MTDTQNSITIPLELSSNATSYFEENNLIQYEAYSKIKKIIENNLLKINSQENIQSDKTRYHESITVLGNRGSGKTSFLLNLESYMQNTEIEFLEILDPTLFENKQHVLLTVITRIITTIEKNENLNTDYKKHFEESLEILADGINLLDGIDDETSHKSVWEDARINFKMGIKCSKKGLDFEKDFRQFIFYALKYLNKKLFVLMFDDIDTNVEKGWPVLEVIRKYLTMLNIQVIVSGDWTLFSKLVRINQLSNLHGLKEIEEKCNDCTDRYDYLETLDTLEEQYLTKILKPENRIILKDLHELIHVKQFFIQFNNTEQSIELEEAYRKLFNYSLLLNNNASFDNFKSLFLSLPLRSNIQLLNSFYHTSSYDEFIENLGKQFLTQLSRYNFSMKDLYDLKSDSLVYNFLKKALELQTKTNFKQLLNLSYFELEENQEKNVLHYVLKSHVTAAINRNKSLLFDWLFRIELFKLFFEKPIVSIEHDLKYLGFGVPSSGRQFLQRLTGYTTNLKGFIGVYKDKSKMKEKSYQHLRNELLKKDSSALIIINLMFSQVSKHNSSQIDLYGSIYYLLGAIGEILALPNTEEALRKYFSAHARIGTVHPYNNENLTTSIFINEENISQNLISKKLISDFQDWLNQRHSIEKFPLDVLAKTMQDFWVFHDKMPDVHNFADYITLQSIYFLRALLNADAYQTFPDELITFQRIRQIETAKQLFKNALNKYNDHIDSKNNQQLRLFKFIYACPIWSYILDDETIDNTHEEEAQEVPLFQRNLFDTMEEDISEKIDKGPNKQQQPLMKLLEGLKLHGSESNKQIEDNENKNLKDNDNNNNDENIKYNDTHNNENTQGINQETAPYSRKDFTYELLMKIFSDHKEELTDIRINRPEELTYNMVQKYRNFLIPQYFPSIKRLSEEKNDELKKAILTFNNIDTDV